MRVMSPYRRAGTRKRKPSGGFRWGAAYLAAALLAVAAGCGLFRTPPPEADPIEEYKVRVGNRKGTAYRLVKAVRRGKGPFDLQVVMDPAWNRRKSPEREEDALDLTRIWLEIVRPKGPGTFWVEFVDDGGKALAWGVFQPERGLFIGFGERRSG